MASTNTPVGALRRGHDDLVEVVSGLSPDDLLRTSGSEDWTVAQVLSHLGSGARIGLATLEAAVNGTEVPDLEFNRSVWAHWDALSPAEQAAEFVTANEDLTARYEGLDQRTRDELLITFPHFPRPVDVTTAAAMRLSEFALHSWDARVAVDPAATIAPEATGILLDGLGMLVSFAGRADRYDGGLSLVVRTSEPTRTLGLVVGESVTLEPDAPDAADGDLVTPAEYLVRLVTGRHQPAHTPASVSATGVDLDDLRKLFPGY
ncbi:maleylpyruvate isomerase family mycothiol-dependent enzyme [Umezawaea sp. NPDC059074]|uniref:maleylpyruvate isomerase family mycothiol-dependent enzyme n=1 Tax=Umezawaea sp. NPDC059074 TaxID=3346716 RepID=UPI00368658E2